MPLTGAQRQARYRAKNRARLNAERAAHRAGVVIEDPRITAYYEVAHWLRERGDSVQVDHIMPLARGGNHAFHNLQILTTEDNRKKNGRIPTPLELRRCRLLLATATYLS